MQLLFQALKYVVLCKCVGKLERYYVEMWKGTRLSGKKELENGKWKMEWKWKGTRQLAMERY